MRKILTYKFFDRRPLSARYIPFPVYIIPFPVLKIDSKPLGRHKTDFVKEVF